MNTTDLLIGGVVGLVLGGGGLALYSMMVRRGAKAQADQILENANRDADLKRRDAEAKAKEIELTRTAEVERNLNKLQEEMHRGKEARSTPIEAGPKSRRPGQARGVYRVDPESAENQIGTSRSTRTGPARDL